MKEKIWSIKCWFTKNICLAPWCTAHAIPWRQLCNRIYRRDRKIIWTHFNLFISGPDGFRSLNNEWYTPFNKKLQSPALERSLFFSYISTHVRCTGRDKFCFFNSVDCRRTHDDLLELVLCSSVLCWPEPLPPPPPFSLGIWGVETDLASWLLTASSGRLTAGRSEEERSRLWLRPSTTSASPPCGNTRLENSCEKYFYVNQRQ